MLQKRFQNNLKKEEQCDLDHKIWTTRSGPQDLDHKFWTTSSGPQDLDHRLWTTGSGPQDLNTVETGAQRVSVTRNKRYFDPVA